MKWFLACILSSPPSYPPHSCQTNPLKTLIFIWNFSNTSFPASCCWKIVSGAFVWHSRLSPSHTFTPAHFFHCTQAVWSWGYVKAHLENSMEVQWLRLCTPLNGAGVWSLVWELRFQMLCGQKKKRETHLPAVPLRAPCIFQACWLIQQCLEKLFLGHVSTLRVRRQGWWCHCLITWIDCGMMVLQEKTDIPIRRYIAKTTGTHYHCLNIL